jgi:hypothetical protein
MRPTPVPVPLLLLAPLLAAPSPLQPDGLGADAYREDLTLLLEEWVPRNDPLDAEGKAEARALIEGAIARADALDDATFTLTVLRVAALSGNGHDFVGLGLLARLPRVPVRLWWFADGLFVVKADEEHADLIGARVDAVGPLEADALLDAFTPYLAGNASWRKQRSIELLTRLPLLAALGASDDPSAATFVLTDLDGERVERTLAAEARPDPDEDVVNPWKESLLRYAGDAGPAGDGRWPHLLDFVEERPRYLRRPEPVFHEREGDVAYVRIASIRDGNLPGGLEGTLFDVLEGFAEDPPAAAVVDLRYNSGGNLFLSVPFAFGVGHVLPPESRLFLLANRGTFSAAIVTMGMIAHEAGRERVTIVGEPIGDPLRFWAEGANLVLPRSEILVSWNDGLHDLLDGCQPDEDCWWGAAAFERGVGDLDPDLVVEERFEDFLEGRDLYLEAVRAELARED